MSSNQGKGVPAMWKRIAILAGLTFIGMNGAAMQREEMIVPVIEGDWWRVASTPDLGEYNSERQQPVDFGLWQAADGTWQLWSCIRNTSYPGHTRLFYGWEGASLTDTEWEPKGIVMESRPDLGEPLGGLQAPHVVRHDGRFIMAYGDWTNICFATSEDGKNFERIIQPNGKTGVFSEGQFANARDPMMIQIDGLWHLYYTAITAGKGYGYCRTSQDLKTWSQSMVISYGGKLSDNPWFNESPHVVEVEPGEFVYFRNQYYGSGNLNWAYYSRNPLNFGIDHDEHLTARLEIAAPEVVVDDGKYYIAALTPELDGIRIARLRWARRPIFGEPVWGDDGIGSVELWRVVEGAPDSIVFCDAEPDPESPRLRILSTAATVDGGSDDKRMVTLESEPFVLDAPFYSLLVGGGNDRERTHVAIVDATTGDELARYTGRYQEKQFVHRIDATSLKGRQVRIRIADRSSDAWGHIAFGGIWRQGEPVIFR
jgi:hypothetical protein